MGKYGLGAAWNLRLLAETIHAAKGGTGFYEWESVDRSAAVYAVADAPVYGWADGGSYADAEMGTLMGLARTIGGTWGAAGMSALINDAAHFGVSIGELWMQAEAFLNGLLMYNLPIGASLGCLKFKGREARMHWTKALFTELVLAPLSAKLAAEARRG